MSYWDVLKDQRFARLAVSTLVGRVGQVMFDVTLVIFIVADLREPSAAGVAVLLATLPGLVLSPFSGSFLQGRNVTGWMAADYAIKGLAAMGIGLAASTGPSGLWLLYGLALLSSITSAFGNVAMRSYISFALAARLRGRANGLDSTLSAVSDMAGPALAGLAVIVFGGRMSVAAVGAVLMFAAVVALSCGRSIHEPGGGMQLRDVVNAMREVWVQPVLRQLSGVYFFYQVAIGILVVASPLLITARYNLDVSWVGISWSVAGAAGIIASLVAGHYVTSGVERRLMFAGAVLTVIGLVGLFTFTNVPGLIAAFVPLGIAVGLLDVGLLTLRQAVLPKVRATGTLAVSSSINLAGYPAGATLGGLLSERGADSQLGAALAFAVMALVMCKWLPRDVAKKETAKA
ncbi:MFS transporter [Trinickia sp. EG282A]|uniref:MFS transporter n=1 Tax=Trinickia sp. EG282A TaxID=3237013 RepID=UPI0034D26628